MSKSGRITNTKSIVPNFSYKKSFYSRKFRSLLAVILLYYILIIARNQGESREQMRTEFRDLREDEGDGREVRYGMEKFLLCRKGDWK